MTVGELIRKTSDVSIVAVWRNDRLIFFKYIDKMTEWDWLKADRWEVKSCDTNTYILSIEV